MLSSNRQTIYHTKAWQQIRKTIWINQGCLCARCGRPVYVNGLSKYLPKEKRLKGIVHHKVWLTEQNYTDDAIAFDTDNLEGLCIDCHNAEHTSTPTRKEYRFDEDGNLIPLHPPHFQNEKMGIE